MSSQASALSVPSAQDALPISIISVWWCYLPLKGKLNVLPPSAVPPHHIRFWLWIHLSPLLCSLRAGTLFHYFLIPSSKPRGLTHTGNQYIANGGYEEEGSVQRRE